MTHLTFIVSVLIISTLAIFIFISYMDINKDSFSDFVESDNISILAKKKYLINTRGCKIPYIDPFTEEVKRFYRKKKYMNCSKKILLSYIRKVNNTITLNINDSLIPLYTSFKISCCYSKVTRYETYQNRDDNIRISECKEFEKSVVISHPLIKVTCRNYFFEVYSNVHAIISSRYISKQTNDMIKSNSTLSILFVGIDSISQLNLMRTMPKTYTFLKNHDFINLKGYTKIASNTLPNLMGLFGGMTMKQLENICDFENNFDSCPIIWNEFNKIGYVTGYGEDSTYIGSFNYQKKGFSEPPTDFYFRPYMLAAETLKIIERGNMYYCTGPENTGERIMNLAKDFQIALKNYPKFGLFWMNSFSHDDFNLPSSMDDIIKEFLDDIYKHLDKTILVFFSDHGFRFGELRETHTGWFEERTPFFYIHFPEIFRNNFPEEYKNFEINSNRLTTPFDIYMTLQNILQLADKNYTIKPSKACPNCHSLFQKVTENRFCSDAGIEWNWCVCNIRTWVNPKRAIVKESAKFLVNHINTIVSNYSQGYKCYRYSLGKVMSARSLQYLNKNNQTVNNLSLRVKTVPRATFEGSIEIFSNGSSLQFRAVGDVSRLERYAPYTTCIEKSSLEKYCYCQ